MTRIFPLQPILPPSPPREIKDTGGAGFEETLQKTLQTHPGLPQASSGV